MLTLILIIKPTNSHAVLLEFYMPPHYPGMEAGFGAHKAEPPQNAILIQQEEPFFCNDYETNFNYFKDLPSTSLIKFAGFALLGTALTRSTEGGVDPNNYWHKPVFLLNLVALLSWSIPQATLTNEYALPPAQYRDVEKVDDRTATTNSNSTLRYKEEPVAGHAITGLSFAGLNLLAEIYNAKNPSPGPGVNVLENFAIGAKSIGVTSNMAAALRIQLKNNYLSRGYTDYEATAAASRDVTFLYIAALAGVVNTGLLNSAAMDGINARDIEQYSWAMADYVGRKYFHVALPAGLMISAAYETVGSLENYCMANFDQVLPHAHYEESEKLVICKGIASVSLASISGLAFSKLSIGLPWGIYVTNSIEAAGLVGGEMAITLGRNLFNHPAAKDAAGLTLGGTVTAGSLLLNLYYFRGLPMTNLFQGSGLIMIYEGGSALVSHSYPAVGKILALGHTLMGNYDYVCKPRTKSPIHPDP
ncbi:hypothetical protein [Endozoicomonas sp. 4G]|uniref:hypothetical protein n=1 Tax=Endozoicomonas sp. 4G TaxID=2872754 RepID=UPI002078BD29|nr:hypothetical protein [Endozoicomonas sp. 4G]